MKKWVTGVAVALHLLKSKCVVCEQTDEWVPLSRYSMNDNAAIMLGEDLRLRRNGDTLMLEQRIKDGAK